MTLTKITERDKFQITEKYIDENGKTQGPYKEYWENGQIKALEHYKNDIEHGIAKYWTSTGKLIYELFITNGKGIGKYFAQNGEIWLVNGKLEKFALLGTKKSAKMPFKAPQNLTHAKVPTK